MPLIHVRLSTKEIENEDELLKELSNEMSIKTGKPEKYVMAILELNCSIKLGGSNNSCCYIEIKSIGNLNPKDMSKAFCNLIESKTGIPANRTYINFADIPASEWGFNGATFG